MVAAAEIDTARSVLGARRLIALKLKFQKLGAKPNAVRKSEGFTVLPASWG